METTHRKAAPIVRLASMAFLIVPLALATLLLGAKVSHATPVPTPAFLSFEEEEAEEEEIEREEEEIEREEAIERELEEGLSEDECEAAGEEAKDGVLTYAEAAAFCAALEEEGGKARTASSADRCALRSARGRATARNKRLKLTIGYTTHRPTKARVEIRVGGRRLATVKRRLGRSGVLRIAKRIGKKHRGKRIRVRIKALPAKGAGRYCAEEAAVLFK
ncbi:MAG: hypothetical protein FVQ78_05585 [Solirubrobacterales bacterium]|nr:hypothetical protein [Solirubrobacterales bacterium]